MDVAPADRDDEHERASRPRERTVFVAGRRGCGVREYAFEQALCARLERPDRIVARQVGGGVRRPGGRVLDT
ncbi:hypothetical protein BRD18_02005, partial [Halobacteriales archaeon SW_7_71_33]